MLFGQKFLYPQKKILPFVLAYAPVIKATNFVHTG